MKYLNGQNYFYVATLTSSCLDEAWRNLRQITNEARIKELLISDELVEKVNDICSEISKLRVEIVEEQDEWSKYVHKEYEEKYEGCMGEGW